jgi:hypothetical protein
MKRAQASLLPERAVQRGNVAVGGGLEFKTERLIGVKRGGWPDEDLGEDGATFVHKAKNRQPAVKHPRGVVAELKSKKDRTARTGRFYRAKIVVRKILTGQ